MLPFIWLAILLLSCIIEAKTRRLYAVWSVPAALSAMILAFCQTAHLWQLVVFVSVFVLGLLVKMLFLKNVCIFGAKTLRMEELIGKRCRIVEEIDNLAGRGAATVGGCEWAAKALEEDRIIPEGSTVEIVAVEGVKLICR